MDKSQERLIIDRFEGDDAFLEEESGAMRRAPRTCLPPGAREGDCLLEQDGHFSQDPKRTLQRREQAAKRLEKLLKKRK